MKTTHAQREVTTNVGESADFTIKANGKAFKVLIDGLYADKIQSITREIWSNALDAHKMAGCEDRPFEVSFPNRFDPSFRVRDFGISLTHDQVMRLYTTVFESLKEDTNDQVGKFGLGSKSPFAYTDSFSVTVVEGGERRFYAAMIGKDGVPTIHYMGNEPSDDEPGVEVSFPVDLQDVPAFAKAARRISYGFDVKPIVTNVQEFEGWPSLHPKLHGNGWTYIGVSPEGYRSNTAYAKMGCVLYPINVSALSDLTQDERSLLQSSIVIDFPVGDLEITASREELSYGRNEPTAASIKARAAQIVAEARDQIDAKFDPSQTRWEQCCAYAELSGDHNMPGFMKGILTRYAKEKGLETAEKLKTHFAYDTMLIDGWSLKRENLSFRTSKETSVSAKPNLVVIFEDCTEKRVKRSAARVRKYLAEKDKPYALWVRLTSSSRMQQIVHDVMERFDGAEFIDIASVEPPPIERVNQPRRPVLPRIYQHGDFNSRVDMDEEMLEEGGIYVPLERMKPVRPEGADGVAYVLAALQPCGVPIPKVYGIPKSLAKEFVGEQWVNLYDYAAEKLKQMSDGITEVHTNAEASEFLFADDLVTLLMRGFTPEDFADDSPAQDIFALIARYREMENSNHAGHVAHLADTLGSRITYEDEDAIMAATNEITLALNTFIEQYPLFGMAIAMPDGDIFRDQLTEYAAMCDNSVTQNHMAIAAE